MNAKALAAHDRRRYGKIKSRITRRTPRRVLRAVSVLKDSHTLGRCPQCSAIVELDGLDRCGDCIEAVMSEYANLTPAQWFLMANNAPDDGKINVAWGLL